jgi:hypothetical protein
VPKRYGMSKLWNVGAHKKATIPVFRPVQGCIPVWHNETCIAHGCRLETVVTSRSAMTRATITGFTNKFICLMSDHMVNEIVKNV